jgi:hypothetical protein
LNYGDVLTNALMNVLTDDFMQTDAVGSCCGATRTFHVVQTMATAVSPALTLWPTWT